MLLGTVGYMSPEQIRNGPADYRSDIFSFGAILFEMFCGKQAFRGSSSADTLSAILRDEPPELSETENTLPVPIRRVVRHCLEKTAERRYQSTNDLAFDLEELSGLKYEVVHPAISHKEEENMDGFERSHLADGDGHRIPACATQSKFTSHLPAPYLPSRHCLVGPLCAGCTDHSL